MPQTVSHYLLRARECSALAEKLPDQDKHKLLEIAQEWLKLADERAKQLQATGTIVPKV